MLDGLAIQKGENTKQSTSLIGWAIALGCGLMIGIQSTFFTMIGREIGPTRASLVLNMVGGILAGAIRLGAIGIHGRSEWNIPRSVLVSALISVAMGIIIIVGIAYSFQRMGVAAGIATLFLGQMLIGIIGDLLGVVNGEAIPLNPTRVLGLFIMAIAVVLLLPRQ